MKSQFILPILLVAIGIACMMHKYKADQQFIDIDLINKGLSGIIQYLPPSSSFTYKAEGVSTDVYLHSRFLLAPRYLSINYKEHFDTVLSISPYNAPDTVVAGITGSRKLIWQNKDDHFAYFLTCSR